jgi:prepilin-type N-terminal cleavage/methylation domain-containing protein
MPLRKPNAPLRRFVYVPARHARGRRFARVALSLSGYALIEVLTALAIFSVGLLPVASLAPVWLAILREQGIASRALRIADEAAERAPLHDPADVSALPPSNAAEEGQLRLCRTPPSDGMTLACLPGMRLAVAGPLQTPGARRTTSQAGLQGIALWVSP